MQPTLGRWGLIIDLAVSFMLETINTYPEGRAQEFLGVFPKMG